jgi:hypothetical protein
MFVANNTVKYCYVACSSDKVDSGQCSCHNNIINYYSNFNLNLRELKLLARKSKILKILNG